MPTKEDPPKAVDIDSRAFARALSRTDLILPINPDNTSPGPCPWTAELGVAPFAVLVGHKKRFVTLALDFDCKHAGPEVADKDARAVSQLLWCAGIANVLVESGPAGGRHVLATISGSGLAAHHMKALVERLRGLLTLETLDITPMCNESTGAIRPPLSAHRSGGTSRILNISEAEALAILRTPQPAVLFKDLLAACPPLQVTATLRVTDTLRPPSRPNDDRSYPSGSEEVMALAAKFVNAGRRFATFTAEAADGGCMSVRARRCVQQHRANGDLDRWLRATWRKAEQWVDDNPLPRTMRDDSQILDSWGSVVSRQTIEDDASRRVAQALLEEARSHGRALVGMSVRQAALASGQSRATAGRALLRLQELGAIEIAGDEASRAGRRYRLQDAALWTTAAPETPDCTSAQGGVRLQTVSRPAVRLAMNLTADIWERGNLGETARQIYLALALSIEATLHVRELVAEVQRTARTVHGHLAALRRVGLVRQLGDGRWAAEYRTAEEAALDLGILPGAAEKRRRMHAEERRQDTIGLILLRLRRRHERSGVPASFAPNENRSQIRDLPVPSSSTCSQSMKEGEMACAA